MYIFHFENNEVLNLSKPETLTWNNYMPILLTYATCLLKIGLQQMTLKHEQLAQKFDFNSNI
jgi:hypothetical protein